MLLENRKTPAQFTKSKWIMEIDKKSRSFLAP